MVTTSFCHWLERIVLCDYEDAVNLYRAVTYLNEYGDFQCSEKNGKYYVTYFPDKSVVLYLGSKKARDYFCIFIMDNYCDSDFGEDIESYWEFQYKITKRG